MLEKTYPDYIYHFTDNMMMSIMINQIDRKKKYGLAVYFWSVILIASCILVVISFWKLITVEIKAWMPVTLGISALVGSACGIFLFSMRRKSKKRI